MKSEGTGKMCQTQCTRLAAEHKRLRDSRIQCDTPLTEQIKALMRSLPPAQRNRP